MFDIEEMDFSIYWIINVFILKVFWLRNALLLLLLLRCKNAAHAHIRKLSFECFIDFE
jgi:hypothetical protein